MCEGFLVLNSSFGSQLGLVTDRRVEKSFSWSGTDLKCYPIATWIGLVSGACMKKILICFDDSKLSELLKQAVKMASSEFLCLFLLEMTESIHTCSKVFPNTLASHLSVCLPACLYFISPYFFTVSTSR